MLAPGKNNQIIVGFDGSDQSARAVEWAADEAAARGAPLTVCHVWVTPYATAAMPSVAIERAAVRDLLEQGTAIARQQAPTIEVSGRLVPGSSDRVMVGLSEFADLVVVGRCGRGAVSELMLGSVSAELVTHGTCPVVIVPDGDAELAPECWPGRIVVGIDGSATAQVALGFALEEARIRKVPVTVVHVIGDGHDGDEAEQLCEEEQFLAALAPWQDKYAEVEVWPRVARMPAREALLAEAPTAQLLVVGSRGFGPARGMLHGSVSRVLTHLAPCPVAVVHGRKEER